MFSALKMGLIGFVFFALIATSSKIGPFKRISGVSDFANDLRLERLDRFNNVVISDRMLFSNLGFIFYGDSLSFYVPYRKNTRIGHHFQKSNPLPSNFNNNFILIGYEEEIQYLTNKYNITLVEEKSVGFTNSKISIYEVVF